MHLIGKLYCNSRMINNVIKKDDTHYTQSKVCSKMILVYYKAIYRYFGLKMHLIGKLYCNSRMINNVIKKDDTHYTQLKFCLKMIFVY